LKEILEIGEGRAEESVMHLRRTSILMLFLVFLLPVESVQAGKLATWCTRLFSQPTPVEKFKSRLNPKLLGPFDEHRALLDGFLKRSVPTDSKRFSDHLQARLLEDLDALVSRKSKFDFLFPRTMPLAKKREELLEAYRIVFG